LDKPLRATTQAEYDLKADLQKSYN
jgi:hypothetical protein